MRNDKSVKEYPGTRLRSQLTFDSFILLGEGGQVFSANRATFVDEFFKVFDDLSPILTSLGKFNKLPQEGLGETTRSLEGGGKDIIRRRQLPRSPDGVLVRGHLSGGLLVVGLGDGGHSEGFVCVS